MAIRPLPELTPSLTAALVSDALDSIGCPNLCLQPEIEALAPGLTLIGRAFPVAAVRVHEAPQIPYVGLLRALDEIGPGDVYVISSEGASDVALWGELLSTIAMARGAVGAVCDGYVRDAAKVRTLGFPVFARGTVPLDIHGRFEVVGHGAPVAIGGIEISPGDLLVADDDGVVVVPPRIEDDVLALAQEKANAEDGFRRDVARGMLPSLAYDTHRVL
jgi:4-hydroxy-4-methyl-2-oxoglutarate aldolase